MGLFDVHAHLTSPKFADADGLTIDTILARARAANVTSIVSNGLNPSDNAAVLALAERYDIVKPAIGLYPVDAVLIEMLAAGLDYPRDVEPLAAEVCVAWVAEHARQAFAIGEIGLDGHWVPEVFWPQQERVFVQLVEIAMAHHLPIIVHSRKREQRMLDILLDMKPERVDWHCFGGKISLGRKIAELPGHFFSIPSNARRSQNFTQMLKTFPREKLLLETDCPYLGKEAGLQSEPAHVADTLRFTAELWGTDSDTVQSQLERNFYTLFGKQP